MSKKKETSNKLDNEENLESLVNEDNPEDSEIPVEEEETQEELSELDQTKLGLSKKDEEIKNLKEEMLRQRAESENFRKRLQKDKQDSIQYANERLIKDLIPIYENLLRALDAPENNPESLKEGVQMISDQFLSFLKKEKVEPIQAVNEKFDPAFHEVMTQMESDEHEEGTVIQEYSRGYLLNDRVISPSKVVISKKPASSDEKEGNGTTEDPQDKKSGNASPETEISA